MKFDLINYKVADNLIPFSFNLADNPFMVIYDMYDPTVGSYWLTTEIEASLDETDCTTQTSIWQNIGVWNNTWQSLAGLTDAEQAIAKICKIANRRYQAHNLLGASKHKAHNVVFIKDPSERMQRKMYNFVSKLGKIGITAIMSFTGANRLNDSLQPFVSASICRNGEPRIKRTSGEQAAIDECWQAHNFEYRNYVTDTRTDLYVLY